MRIVITHSSIQICICETFSIVWFSNLRFCVYNSKKGDWFGFELKRVLYQPLNILNDWFLGLKMRLWTFKSIHIGGVKLLKCYFLHHKLQKVYYIGGAICKNFNSSATVHSHL